MSIFPNFHKVLKSGIVLIDPQTCAVQRIINSTLQPGCVSGAGIIK